MRMVDIIQKKRDGIKLSREEIDFAIQGYTNGSIPDYQMSAFTMAIYFKGMDMDEISNMTMAMVHSGDVIDLSEIQGTKVDKHSTGGVGDKTSLIVAPLVASVGIPVAKMSGRGLGHTGGTVDKLESIPGFNIELDKSKFIENVNTIKMALVGQSGNLAPADKKLYALRDVTATVNSIPLIASSIMSKKIASGADAIVLDVKVGSGAFMKNLDDAKELAKTMVGIGKSVNKQTIAILTNMSQPLGYEVGNANEVKEAIDVLMGNGEEELTELCVTIASHMAVCGGLFDNAADALQVMQQQIRSKAALSTFNQFVEAQGGIANMASNVGQLPQAHYHIDVKSTMKGYIQSMDAEQIGIAAMILGAGRNKKEDQIDYAAGITLRKKIGDFVEENETLAIMHTNISNVEVAESKINNAFQILDKQVEKKPIVYEIVT